ncbi:hypothetical protein [Aeromonas jandaei]|uniref:hypothetical protein n=1 Tax=Aeromonas jandaei TaxID=650 RepID=UPI001ADD93BE|nr:hypothetical protein [Aeromonas jandaei]
MKTTHIAIGERGDAGSTQSRKKVPLKSQWHAKNLPVDPFVAANPHKTKPPQETIE